MTIINKDELKAFLNSVGPEELTIHKLVAALKVSGQAAVDMMFEDGTTGESVAIVALYGTSNVKRFIAVLESADPLEVEARVQADNLVEFDVQIGDDEDDTYLN